MSISYNGLFSLLQKKGLTKTALTDMLGISSRTMSKLSKNEYVSLKVIDDICAKLGCQPSDIMSFVRDNSVSRILQVLREEKQMQLKGGLYHSTQIKMTYNSNHLEGSQLSEDQTRYIFDTNTIGFTDNPAVNVDDIIETKNHFRCIDYVIDNTDGIITEPFIKKLHELLKSGTSDSQKEWFAIGDYKHKPNVVGDSKTVSPLNVHNEIVKLLDEYNRLETVTIADIIAFHYRFESIHPFQDGNGRVGRLIAFKECLRFNITPFIIDEELKMFYYRGLKEWENEPGYLLDTCKAGQDKYQAIVNYFIES
ncbi:MAG: Fic family protein [Clostridia bacterium]|nr:Fic family protein [Clostridia bacterium]